MFVAEYHRDAPDRNSLASLAAKGDPVTKCFAMEYEPTSHHGTQHQHTDECNSLGNGRAMIQREPIQPNDLIQSLPDSWSQWDCYVKEKSTS